MQSGIYFDRLFRSFFKAKEFGKVQSFVYLQDEFLLRLQFWCTWVKKQNLETQGCLEVSFALLAFHLYETRDTNDIYIEYMRILQIAVFSLPVKLQMDWEFPKIVGVARKCLFNVPSSFLDTQGKKDLQFGKQQPWLVSLLFHEIPLLDCMLDVDRFSKLIIQSVYFQDERCNGIVAWVLVKMACLSLEMYTLIVQKCVLHAPLQFIYDFVELYQVYWFMNLSVNEFHLPLLYILTCPSICFQDEYAAKFPVLHARKRMYLAVGLFSHYLSALEREKGQSVFHCGLQLSVAKPHHIIDTCDLQEEKDAEGNETKTEWVALHMWFPKSRMVGYSFHIPKEDFYSFPYISNLYKYTATCYVDTNVRCRSLPMVVASGLTILRLITPSQLLESSTAVKLQVITSASSSATASSSSCPEENEDVCDLDTLSISDMDYSEDMYIEVERF